MKLKFPSNFQFGSAFSGPQTEGTKNMKGKTIYDDDYKNHVERYFQQKYVVNDFYDNYKEDIRLAKEMGLTELRTSIQWSRLMPDGKNVDQDAVDFYNNVINEMIAQGIRPMFALHHYDMPTWAQALGGWQSREVVDKFAEYGEKVFSLFGDRVDAWFTFNEPQCVAWDGHIFNIDPPFIQDAKIAVQVQWNSLIAHHKCVAAHKKLGIKGRYGAILVFCATMPAKNIEKDIKAAELLDMFKWRCYSDPMFNGVYPKELEDKFEEVGIKFKEEPGDRDLIKNNTIDYFGLNYYKPAWAKAPEKTPQKGETDKYGLPIMHEDYLPPFLLMNPSRQWAVFPFGIYYTIKKMRELYGKDLDIYISENGIGVQNEYVYENEQGMIEDDYRILYFKMHMAYVIKAINEGAKVHAYHSWAYLDNWSWKNAYKNRYGSVSLDIETGKRSLKKSYAWWQKISKTKEIDVDEYILKAPFLKMHGE